MNLGIQQFYQVEPGRGVWAGDRVGNIYIVTKTVEVEELSPEEGHIDRE